VSTEQQDTTYLSEAVEAVESERPGWIYTREALEIAEPYFASHYEQKGAEGERAKLLSHEVRGRLKRIAAMLDSTGTPEAATFLRTLADGSGGEEIDPFTHCVGCGKPNGSTADCDLCGLFREEAASEGAILPGGCRIPPRDMDAALGDAVDWDQPSAALSEKETDQPEEKK